MGSDPQYVKWPLLPLSQHVFTLTNGYATKIAQQAAVKALQDAIAQDKMAPFYRYLAHPLDGVLNTLGEGGSSAPGRPLSRKSSLVGMIATKPAATIVSLPWDEGLYNQLKEDNDRELQEFQKEEDDAVEQAGDTEVMAAQGKRAEFWARVGDKVCSHTETRAPAARLTSPANTHQGQGHCRLREPLRKDGNPRYQDRRRPRHNTHGSLLWRQASCQEARRTCEDTCRIRR